MLLKVSATVEHRLTLGFAFFAVALLDLLVALLSGGDWCQLFALPLKTLVLGCCLTATIAVPPLMVGRLVAAYLLTHPPQLGDLHENSFLLAFLPIALANIAALAVCTLFVCLLLT